MQGKREATVGVATVKMQAVDGVIRGAPVHRHASRSRPPSSCRSTRNQRRHLGVGRSAYDRKRVAREYDIADAS
jgi:hypothetical protein